MHVLDRMLEPLDRGAVALDLQVIRPGPQVEVGGNAVCGIDGRPLFRTADAAARAVDACIAAGWVVEEAVDDHDVLRHYSNGTALVDDWATKPRPLPARAVPLLRTIDRPCAVRERSRLRRLRMLRRRSRRSCSTA